MGRGKNTSLSLFLKGSIISIAFSVAAGLINFFTRRLLAIQLPLDEYGFFNTTISLLTMVIAFISTPLAQSGTILIAKAASEKDPRKANETFNILLVLQISFALIAVLALVFLAAPITRHFFKHPEWAGFFQIGAVWLGSQFLLGPLASFFEGTKKYAERQLLQFSYYCVSFILMIVIGARLSAGKAFSNMAIGAAVSVLCLGALQVKKRNVSLTSISREARSSLFHIIDFSKWIFISASGFIVLQNLDLVMLQLIGSSNDAGLYSGILPITQIFIVVLLVFPQVFTPIAVDLIQEGSYTKLSRYIFSIFAIMVAGMSIGLFVLYHWRDQIITLLFKKEFTRASIELLIISAGIPMLAIGQLITNVLAGMGRQRTSAMIILLSVAIAAASHALLIPRLGIRGAALSVLIGYSALCLLSMTSYLRIVATTKARP